MVSTSAILLVSSLAVLSASLSKATDGVPVANGLSFGFYKNACPGLEGIVRSTVEAAVRKEVALAAGLLRIFFQDCFPQGCDASLLLAGSRSEQQEGPNQSLQPNALRLIEDIRNKVHAACGPRVSCADITTLATRDAVSVSRGIFFDVPLGRRDSFAPAPSDKVGDLPSPFSDVSTLIDAFKSRNLDATDLVALSGAHTVGRAHCNLFSDRLQPGADIDPKFAQRLRANCSKDSNRPQNLDVRSPDVFDNKYYANLIAKQGVFTSDQGLMSDNRTKRTATRFALNQAAFFDQFAKSMVKLSQTQVITGNNGEIRRNCAAPNGRRIAETVTAADDGEERFAASA